MRARVTVEADGTARLRMPGTVPPGEHEVVVVVEERAEAGRPRKSMLEDFPVDDYGPWPERLSLRRQDTYGDDGR